MRRNIHVFFNALKEAMYLGMSEFHFSDRTYF